MSKKNVEDSIRLNAIFNFSTIKIVIWKLADAGVHSILLIKQLLVVTNFTQSLKHASSILSVFSNLQIRKLVDTKTTSTCLQNNHNTFM